jgi:hypothetical protein
MPRAPTVPADVIDAARVIIQERWKRQVCSLPSVSH